MSYSHIDDVLTRTRTFPHIINLQGTCASDVMRSIQTMDKYAEWFQRPARITIPVQNDIVSRLKAMLYTERVSGRTTSITIYEPDLWMTKEVFLLLSSVRISSPCIIWLVQGHSDPVYWYTMLSRIGTTIPCGKPLTDSVFGLLRKDTTRLVDKKGIDYTIRLIQHNVHDPTWLDVASDLDILQRVGRDYTTTYLEKMENIQPHRSRMYKHITLPDKLERRIQCNNECVTASAMRTGIDMGSIPSTIDLVERVSFTGCPVFSSPYDGDDFTLIDRLNGRIMSICCLQV